MHLIFSLFFQGSREANGIARRDDPTSVQGLAQAAHFGLPNTTKRNIQQNDSEESPKSWCKQLGESHEGCLNPSFCTKALKLALYQHLLQLGQYILGGCKMDRNVLEPQAHIKVYFIRSRFSIKKRKKPVVQTSPENKPSHSTWHNHSKTTPVPLICLCLTVVSM